MKKILFSTDCNGNFELLFSKVSQLNQKTKFDLMFLVGNVCPVEAGKEFDKIAKGQITVPIPTYFINSSPMSKVFEILYPQGQQIGSNFHFLGKQGVKNIQGLNVCYLNGTSSQNSLTALNIIANYGNSKIDILLTNQWPVEILQNYKQKVILNSQTQTRSSETVSLLNYSLSPRYHLAASGKQFYRMEPYLNAKGQSTHFINVAQIIKDDLKDKYLLAIQLVPYSLNPPAEDTKNNVPSLFDKEKYEKLISNRLDRPKNIVQNNSTEFIQNDKQNPSFRQTYQLKQSQKPKQQQSNLYEDSYIYFDCVPAQARSVDIQQFLQRWGTITKLQVFEQTKGGFRSGLVKFQTFQQSKKCLQDSGKYSLYQSRIKFKPKNISQKYHNADCWFCEKNDRFDRELLVWKGKYCMICLDKGPIAEVHLQIIPYNHVDTLGKLQSIQVEEIEFVKNQLSTYFTRQQYQVIFSQRYIGLSEQINHCILHFIAIESQLSLTSRFMQLNQQHRFNFFKIQNAQSHKRKTQHFIKLTINEVQFIKQIYQKQKTDAQFPRRVICEVINQPSKINWRNCELQDKQIKDKREKMGNVLNKCLE